MWTLQDAKNRFSAVVDAALAGQPQQVTRRGKPAVAALGVADYHRRGSFLQHLLDFPGLGDDPDPLSQPQARPRDVDF